MSHTVTRLPVSRLHDRLQLLLKNRAYNERVNIDSAFHNRFRAQASWLQRVNEHGTTTGQASKKRI